MQNAFGIQWNTWLLDSGYIDCITLQEGLLSEKQKLEQLK